jgi:hypothetical protein
MSGGLERSEVRGPAANFENARASPRISPGSDGRRPSISPSRANGRPGWRESLIRRDFEPITYETPIAAEIPVGSGMASGRSAGIAHQVQAYHTTAEVVAISITEKKT